MATSERTVALYAPITKFEEQPDESLEVFGLVSSEVLDRQNEITDFDGFMRAMKDWSGNIREMHQPIAAGRAIELLPNPDERNAYLRVRVSKGAPDTIAKVKDGTLAGYSIGGKVSPNGRIGAVVDESLMSKYALLPPAAKGEKVSILKDWSCYEISLVDAPANPQAQISIAKAVGGEVTMSDVVRKEEEAAPAETAAPAPVAEPANPAADEMGSVAVLQRIKTDLATLAQLEAAEIGDEGTQCMRDILAMLDSAEWLQRMKVQNAAMEVADTMTQQPAEQVTAAVGKAAGVSVTLDKGLKKQLAAIGKAHESAMKAYAQMGEAIKNVLKEYGEIEEEAEESQAAVGAEENPKDQPPPEKKADEAAPVADAEKSITAQDVVKTMAPVFVDDVVSKLSGVLGETVAKFEAAVSDVKASVEGLGSRVETIEKSPSYRGPIVRDHPGATPVEKRITTEQITNSQPGIDPVALVKKAALDAGADEEKASRLAAMEAMKYRQPLRVS